MAKIKFNLLACCSIGLASFFLTFFGACQLKNKSNLVDNNNKKELYATNFSIQEYTDYQLVTIYKTWAGAANEIKYALYPREKPMPNLPADVVAIAVPVQKIVCTSSVQVAMLDFLGETDKIIGLADGKYIYNPLIFNKLENKQIADLGNDNSFNYEKLLALQPEITLVFGLNGDSKIAKKLSELGQKVIYIAEFLETEPLGRAEWVKVVAALLGKSTKEKADVLFKDSVEIPYLKIKNQLTNNQKKPTILTGLAYEGIWYVAGGSGELLLLKGCNFGF